MRRPAFYERVRIKASGLEGYVRDTRWYPPMCGAKRGYYKALVAVGNDRFLCRMSEIEPATPAKEITRRCGHCHTVRTFSGADVNEIIKAINKAGWHDSPEPNGDRCETCDALDENKDAGDP